MQMPWIQNLCKAWHFSNLVIYPFTMYGEFICLMPVCTIHTPFQVEWS